MTVVAAPSVVFAFASVADLDELVDFLVAVYCSVDALCQALGFGKDRASRRAVRELLAADLKHPLSLLARDGRGGRIVACETTLMVNAAALTDPLKTKGLTASCWGELSQRLVESRRRAFCALPHKLQPYSLLAHLHTLAVHPDFRRLGIGRRLVEMRLKDKGNVISMKLSPDLSIVAIQRAATCVDLANLQSEGETVEPVEYEQSCKSKSARILGIEWVGKTELLFVTDHGLELYTVLPEKRALRSPKVFNLSINWFVYDPSNNLLLTSSGTLGTTLQTFIVKNGAITKHCKFEVDLGSTPKPPKLTLLDRDVTIATLYGEVCLLVLRHSPRDATGAEVLVYTLKEAGETPRRTATLQLGLSGLFALHAIDNLVVVHHQPTKRSLLFDLRGTDPRRPLAPPHGIQIPDRISTRADTAYDRNVQLYAASWVVFAPDVIIDARLGCLWRLRLNLAAGAAHIGDKGELIRFLLHRADCKPLILSTLRAALFDKQLTRAHAGTCLATIADIEAQRRADKAKIAELATGRGALTPRSFDFVAVDQSDMYSAIFHPLSDQDGVDLDYLIDVVLQYLLALQERKVDVQPFMHELLLSTLVKARRFEKLHQIVQYRVVTDSKALAFLLLSLETKYPPALQLALDMLVRLGNTIEEVVEVFLSKGMVFEAIRHVEAAGYMERTNQMKFVEVAWQHDRHLRYAVFSYLQQRSLKLRGTTKFASGDKFEQYRYEFKRLYPSEERTAAAQLDGFYTDKDLPVT